MESAKAKEILGKQMELLSEDLGGELNLSGDSTDIGVNSKIYAGSFFTRKPLSHIIFESLEQLNSC